MRQGEEIAAAARALVGARYRLHGRDPAFGLDCVGVAAAAFGRSLAGDYPLRGRGLAEVAAGAGAAGLRAVEAGVAGDLVAIDAGRGQLHLAVLTEGGFVHAHAGLRRVVESPGRPEGVLAMWRAG